jgi:hypothetical protein
MNLPPESSTCASDSPKCPEFRPSIPSHLMENAAPGQKFLMERISVLIQSQKWQGEKLLEMTTALKHTQLELDNFSEFKISEEGKTEAKRRAYKWKRAFFLLLATVGYPVYLEVGKQLGLMKLVESLFATF